MSLLLDALKQAEKAKQERSGEISSAAGLEIERPTETEKPVAIEAPAGKAGKPRRELSIEPMEDGLDALPGDDVDDDGRENPRRDNVDLDETPENSDSGSLNFDLEELATRLSDSTGKFSRRPGDEDLTPPEDTGEFDPHSATMPSLKNVQQSLRDFYDGTGKMTADEVTSAMASQRTPSDTGATTRVSQREAENVFTAKTREPKKNSRTPVLLGVLVVLLLVGGGGYYWITTSGMTTVARPPVARVPAPVRPMTGPATVAKTPLKPAEATRGAIAATPAPAMSGSAGKPSPQAGSMTPEETLAAATTPQSAPAPEAQAGTEVKSEPPAQVSAAAPAPAPGNPARSVEQAATGTRAPQPSTGRSAVSRQSLPIRIARRPVQDPNYRQTRRAYDSFRRGDLGDAAAAYRAVLKKDPQNRDALLGLGAVALKGGRADEAEQLYLRVLALNPKDRLALAALTSLQTLEDPVQTESRLKILLDKTPGEGYLHFALGNVYAAQNRWPEAQQSFFNAYSTDKQNGDYAFNLAISLEHLGQPGAAVGFYREALKQADVQSVTFDRASVVRRIEALSMAAGAAPS